MKKGISFVLILVMLLFAVPVTNVQAKTQTKKVTVYTGEVVKLWVIMIGGGTPRWVNKTPKLGKLKKENNTTYYFAAKKRGTAKIQASNGRSTVNFVVKVKEAPTEKKIQVKKVKYKKGVLLFLKNKNREAVRLKVSAGLLDENGEILKTGDGYVSCLGKKGSTIIEIPGPYGENAKPIADVEVKMDVKPTTNKPENKHIAFERDTVGESELNVEVINKSAKKISGLKVGALFLDAEENVLDFKTGYPLAAQEPKGSDFVKFGLPLDESYKPVVPASYRLFVLEAYSY